MKRQIFFAIVVTACVSRLASAQTAGLSPLTAPVGSAATPESGTASAGNPFASPKPSTFVSDLFAPLPGDFRQMGSSQNWLVAGIGSAGAVAARSVDARVAGIAWSTASGTVMQPGEIVGSFAAQSGLALATYATGRLSGSPRMARVGAALFRAQIVSQATAQVLKISTHRTRPDGTSLSFPSGHSASMFATATVLQSEFGWKVGVPAYVAASWVAASRVEANRHFVSDVIAGATVGILAGRSVSVGSNRLRFAMGPMVVPGGVGVALTKIPALGLGR